MQPQEWLHRPFFFCADHCTLDFCQCGKIFRSKRFDSLGACPIHDKGLVDLNCVLGDVRLVAVQTVAYRELRLLPHGGWQVKLSV